MLLFNLIMLILIRYILKRILLFIHIVVLQIKLIQLVIIILLLVDHLLLLFIDVLLVIYIGVILLYRALLLQDRIVDLLLHRRVTLDAALRQDQLRLSLSVLVKWDDLLLADNAALFELILFFVN